MGKRRVPMAAQLAQDMGARAMPAPVFSLSLPDYRGKEHFGQMNAELQKQATRVTNLHFLDLERLSMLAARGGWRNSEDKIHFMCGVRPPYDDAAKGPLQMKGFRKVLDAYDCSDPVNLALLEAIVAVICSEQK